MAAINLNVVSLPWYLNNPGNMTPIYGRIDEMLNRSAAAIDDDEYIHCLMVDDTANMNIWRVFISIYRPGLRRSAP